MANVISIVRTVEQKWKMSKFINKEEIVNIGDPVIFENNTDSDFEVSVGIIFYKSGVYNVSIEGNKTIVSNVGKSKIGKWINKKYYFENCYAECDQCHKQTRGITEDGGFGFHYSFYNFCPNCGVKMTGCKDENVG